MPSPVVTKADSAIGTITGDVAAGGSPVFSCVEGEVVPCSLAALAAGLADLVETVVAE
jgi:hypothetical protein